MAQEIYQVRFYSDQEKNRSFGTITNDDEGLNSLVQGTAFKYPIIQLGIECNEGTLFYLNNSLTTVTVGPSGLFQLDDTRILSLRFIKASIDAIKSQGYLIVNYIREV